MVASSVKVAPLSGWAGVGAGVAAVSSGSEVVSTVGVNVTTDMGVGAAEGVGVGAVGTGVGVTVGTGVGVTVGGALVGGGVPIANVSGK